MLKVNNKDIIRRQWRRCYIITVDLEHVSQLVLMFLLLTLNRQLLALLLKHVFSINDSQKNLFLPEGFPQ